MIEFFKLNWIVFVVTGLLIVGGNFAEQTKHMITKVFKVEPKSFYMIVSLLGIVISVVNYIAVIIFGSWTSMIITTLAVLVVAYVIRLYIKKK